MHSWHLFAAREMCQATESFPRAVQIPAAPADPTPSIARVGWAPAAPRLIAGYGIWLKTEFELRGTFRDLSLHLSRPSTSLLILDSYGKAPGF